MTHCWCTLITTDFLKFFHVSNLLQKYCTLNRWNMVVLINIYDSTKDSTLVSNINMHPHPYGIHSS